jgi:hypothetical protein
MRRLVLVSMSLSLSGAAAVAACKPTSTTMNELMLGSYVRHDPTMMGMATKTSHLEVAATGMTMRSSGLGLEMVGGLGGAEGRVTDEHAASLLFRAVDCDGSTCRFKGQEARCEGTITRDAAGDVTVVATGPCTSLSGKWLGPSSAARSRPRSAVPSFH